jgi:hypothetical protein
LTSTLFVLSLSLISCEKDDAIEIFTCVGEVQNPTQDILWLKGAIEEDRNDQYSYYSTAD